MSGLYVKPFKVNLRDDAGENAGTLLWGDKVMEIERSGDQVKVRARRDYEGWIKAEDLMEESLLEIYIIDVGQGDGVLLKTPSGDWHLIDAGVANAKQMTRKGVANFLRWKFLRELGEVEVRLRSVVLTHPDSDHFGGLVNVFSGKLSDIRTGEEEKRAFEIKVGEFYHNGLGRFDDSDAPLGATDAGEVDAFPNDGHDVRRDGQFIYELLDGRDTFENPPRPFTAEFAGFVDEMLPVAGHIQRLSHRDGHLPGYGVGEDPSGLEISVLGPILEEFAPGRVGLRSVGGESIIRNGHSIVLRLDYKDARFLLTGDLNKASQKLLLSYLPEDEYAVDVAKGCHHGSEDITIEFVSAMKARATVISSGDNEEHSHPRPLVMGASARYGREPKDIRGRTMPPLLYSTELARSTKVSYVDSVQVSTDPQVEPQTFDPKAVSVRPGESRASYQPLRRTPVMTDLVYGLVNVRTDGKHILCATMEEKGKDFDHKVFRAGV